jgi:hypothetical protein
MENLINRDSVWNRIKKYIYIIVILFTLILIILIFLLVNFIKLNNKFHLNLNSELL